MNIKWPYASCVIFVFSEGFEEGFKCSFLLGGIGQPGRSVRFKRTKQLINDASW